MLCSFLAAYPHLSGTVIDLPEVLTEKDQLWAGRLGLEERVDPGLADLQDLRIDERDRIGLALPYWISTCRHVDRLVVGAWHGRHLPHVR